MVVPQVVPKTCCRAFIFKHLICLLLVIVVDNECGWGVSLQSFTLCNCDLVRQMPSCNLLLLLYSLPTYLLTYLLTYPYLHIHIYIHIYCIHTYQTHNSWNDKTNGTTNVQSFCNFNKNLVLHASAVLMVVLRICLLLRSVSTCLIMLSNCQT